MTGGTYLEQIQNTKNTKEADLTYYCMVMFGERNTVSQITKKLSLYKK
jgi:hypothetical protein